VFGRENILSTTMQNVSVYKSLLVRKIAEVLVVYSMYNKGILKGIHQKSKLFIPNPFSFTTELVAFQELLKLNFFLICSYSALCDSCCIWLDHSAILLASKRWLTWIVVVTETSTLLPEMLRVGSILDLLSKTWHIPIFEEIDWSSSYQGTDRYAHGVCKYLFGYENSILTLIQHIKTFVYNLYYASSIVSTETRLVALPD